MRTVPTMALALALVIPAVSAVAQDAMTRVRGTVASLNGNTMVVTARRGQKVTVTLAGNLMVTQSGTTSLSDVHAGSFIGTTTVVQPDGSMKALEVHVFPESMRGSGEGSRPWDLAPASTMTNGTVGQITGASSRSLTVKYQDGQKTVVVPPDVPVVSLEPGSKAQLVPGAHVFVIATKAADGSLTAGRITVGKNGAEPPM